MKKTKKILIGLLVSLFAVGIASCGDGEIDSSKESTVSIEESSLEEESSSEEEIEIVGSEGLEYELNFDEKCYSVIGIGTCTDTDLVIPSTHEGLPVTSIGYWAFEFCESLTSVVIPDGVTSIGGRAFSSCRSLISVAIPDSVTIIGWDAFYGCSSLTSVVIPDSVTSVGVFSFWNCESLTDVVIGDGVTSIGDYAFGYCDSLTSVVIPDSVTNIGDHAFSYCDSLTSIAFNGTIEQWNAITKGSDWNHNVSATEVVCSDGTVAL